jgi:hypothetical protein
MDGENETDSDAGIEYDDDDDNDATAAAEITAHASAAGADTTKPLDPVLILLPHDDEAACATIRRDESC